MWYSSHQFSDLLLVDSYHFRIESLNLCNVYSCSGVCSYWGCALLLYWACALHVYCFYWACAILPSTEHVQYLRVICSLPTGKVSSSQKRDWTNPASLSRPFRTEIPSQGLTKCAYPAVSEIPSTNKGQFLLLLTVMKYVHLHSFF